ncbi:hypothetical protein OSB04_024685 [Centaurea solstitialis]|uniref:Uncharacterized protein n=1 Tax=Centaurea solstitialis TaxID=347529 RepID=A0AA38SM84_9ASTR|nr:hypothetical protein OSB04_024685 [Centaurea solstitialis]
MANNINSSFLSAGTQPKPPTLIREEYPQWNVRMINFLEGIHPRISEFLYNPPYVPMDLIPRVPTTGGTPEITEHYEPKSITNWSKEDKVRVELGSRCKRLLIMAMPHEIFKYIDHCHLSMDIWAELEKQIEGGRKTLKNNQAICIDEYHSFKIERDNNSLFLKSLGTQWMNLTISMKATLDLEVWTLADLFGSLKNLRATSSPNEEREWKEKKKKKKALIAKSDESSEDKVSMQEMMKTLTFITREYRKGGKKRDYRSSETKKYRENRKRKRSERRERDEQKTPQRIHE